MSRSEPRSGSRDPRRGGGSSRSRDEWDGGWQDQRGGGSSRGAGGRASGGRDAGRDAGRERVRSGGRDGSANRSRGRGESARSTQRRDDRWDDRRDDRRDDQRGWNRPPSSGGLWGDESEALPASGGGGLWGDGYSAQAPTPQWPGNGGRGQAGGRYGAAPAGAQGGPDGKVDLKTRIRFWMTKDAWRMSLLRTWPSLLRLMVAVALLGSCGGLTAFMVRAQGGVVGGVGQSRANLVGQHVGPGTPTPDLYQSDPFTPPPLPDPTATKTKPTVTPSPVQLQVTLTPMQAQCSGQNSPLPPVTLTLDNSHSTVDVTWALTLGPGLSGARPWAQATPDTQGTLPAGAPPQNITLTPDLTLCGQLFTQGQPGHFTAQVTTTPGGQTSTQTFTVLPFSAGGGPTPSPSPVPSPSPTKTP